MSAPRISEEAQADVKLPGAERRREGVEIDQDRGRFSTEAQFRGMPLCVQLNQKVNDSVGPPRGSTVINSPEGHDLGGPSGASSGDHPRTFDGPGDRDRRAERGFPDSRSRAKAPKLQTHDMNAAPRAARPRTRGRRKRMAFEFGM